MTRSLLALALVQACCQPAPASQPPTTSDAPPQSVVIPEPEGDEPTSDPAPVSEPSEARGARRTTPSGLGIEEIKRGSGAVATPGRIVTLHYHGTLEDGTVFDSSRERNSPFVFDLSKGHVIKGFEEGVAGMRVGEVRRITIPPELGYGSSGRGKIPANAILIYEIELLEVK